MLVDVATFEGQRGDDLSAGLARSKLLADALRPSGFADDEASFSGQAARRERPREDARDYDRAERDYPQRRDLIGADSPSEDEVLEDRHTKREQAGQLGQLRYIVERRVHEPEIVAVVEAGELEHEQDQSRSDHR